MKKLFVMLTIIAVMSVVSGDARDIKLQKIRFTYTFTVKEIPPESKKIKFWIPHPFESHDQSIIKSHFRMPGSYSFINDNIYNNKIILGTADKPKSDAFTVSATYEVERKERLNKLDDVPAAQQTDYPPEVARFLKPSMYAVITPRIKKLAREITAGKTTPLSKAKAIYDYVLTHMEYNKVAEGWGKGDSERACIIGKGNCTDFHSLFNSLTRAVNIPAKFVIGFPIPNEKQATIKGYHCWAEFYLCGYGWVPVDISEAWKDKNKSAYYFGNLPENRIGFTVGRDIVIDPAAKDFALNYFIYPHIEIDGVATHNIEKTFTSELL